MIRTCLGKFLLYCSNEYWILLPYSSHYSRSHWITAGSVSFQTINSVRVVHFSMSLMFNINLKMTKLYTCVRMSVIHLEEGCSNLVLLAFWTWQSFDLGGYSVFHRMFNSILYLFLKDATIYQMPLLTSVSPSSSHKF